MGLLLGIVLVMLGGAVLWAGATGNEKAVFDMFGLVNVVKGTPDPRSGDVPRNDGYPHGAPWPDGARGKDPTPGEGNLIWPHRAH